MALCDFVITQNIAGIDCSNPPVKGVERVGVLINRADVDFTHMTLGGSGKSDFYVNIAQDPEVLKCDTQAYKIIQTGKQPFNGTQQEMVEGANVNTITNTVQFVVLKQDEEWAEQLFALVNGEFIALLANKDGTFQVYGYETGLHCTGAVRELYSDDNLAGWVLTFTEEGAVRGNLFTDSTGFEDLLVNPGLPCEP